MLASRSRQRVLRPIEAAAGSDGHVIASEGPDVRLRGMNWDTSQPRGPSPGSTLHQRAPLVPPRLTAQRRRPTDFEREATRLVNSMTAVLGSSVKAGRTRLHLTQEGLADRVGVHQSWISKIESGHGRAVPLALWVRIGHALGQPFAASMSRPIGEPRQPIDAGHLAMQEHLLRLARTTGRTASFELPTRPHDPTRSIDVCVRDAQHRVLIIEEAWNTFGDIGAAIRATNRKSAEALDLAATIDDGPPYRVAIVWIIRDSAANREIIGRYPEIVQAAFPGSSRGWVDALTRGTAPPEAKGFAWYDPATNRVGERRRPAQGRDR